MFKRRKMLKNIVKIMVLAMLFTTILAFTTVLAEGTVNWKSNTQNTQLNPSEGIQGKSTDWSSQTYQQSDSNTSTSTGSSSENDESTGNGKSTSNATALALLAGMAGVLGLTAAGEALSRKKVDSIIPQGEGIWVVESDRKAVLDMINKAASKQYYIDDTGFLRAVDGCEVDTSKSDTYSKLLDRLIAGDKKVIIGVDSGWEKYDDSTGGTVKTEFSKANGGITIGDNGTDQVVIVSGQDTDSKDVDGNKIYSGADIALVHELTHALRGEYGQKEADLNGEETHDEEAHVIQMENKIRTELGYGLRGDGDVSDDVNGDGKADGDGSYGEYNDNKTAASWYNDVLNGTAEAAIGKETGNIYNYYWTDCVTRTDCGHWEQSKEWVSSGYWNTSNEWVKSGYWNTGTKWVSSGYWTNSNEWVTSGYWGTGQRWVNSGYWRDTSKWVDSGHWETRQRWVGSGYWDDSKEWVTSGYWSNPSRVDCGYYTSENRYVDCGHWSTKSTWIDCRTSYKTPYWTTSGWRYKTTYSDCGHWYYDRTWVDCSHWQTYKKWNDCSHWDYSKHWVDTSHWKYNHNWVSTAHYENYDYWVNTGHWEYKKEWVDTSHNENYSYWVNTSHWQNVQKWVNTSHYENYNYWVDTSRWQSTTKWVDTSHWQTSNKWVDCTTIKNTIEWRPDPNLFTVTENFLAGIGEGIVDTAKGIWDTVTDPARTIEGAKFLGKALLPGTQEHALFTAIVKDAVMNAWKDFSEGDDNEKAKMIGKLVSEVVLAVVGTKGTTAATDALKACVKSGELTNLLSKVGKGTAKADDIVATLKKFGDAISKLKNFLKNKPEAVFENIKSVINASGDLKLTTVDGLEYTVSRSELKAQLIAEGESVQDAEAALKCLEDGCFAGDTLVLTKDGLKRIDSIQEGEHVFAKEVNTGEEAYKKVQNVYIKSTNKFVCLNVDDEEIRTTSTHLFFMENGNWKSAENINQGDKILDSYGNLKDVVSVEFEQLEEYERIYNLNVEEYHTYFVGSQNLLVHNNCTEEMTDTAKKLFGRTDANAIADGTTDVTEAEAIALGRPTWRQSEIDAAKDFPESSGYSDQVSFKKDASGKIKDASYGEKGSIRPDYYKPGHCVDIKNYNVTTSSGRSRLIENIRKQYWQRKEFFGAGTKQTYVLDVRGQNVSRDVLDELENAIHNQTDTLVEIIIKKQ